MGKFFRDEYFEKYNWLEIQEFYDNGGTWKEVIERFNISNNGLAQSVKKGLLQTRSKSDAMKLYCKNNKRTLSDETKEKLSKIRKEYLRKNPDKVPYLLNHSSNYSYPEKYFERIFENENIETLKKFRIHTYELDFAIPDKKIDIEIDGEQHYSDDKIVESDLRRNKYLEDRGWDVIRIRWSSYQKLEIEEKKLFINDIKNYINKLIDIKPTIKYEKPKKICKHCNNKCTNKNRRCRKCYEKQNRKVKNRPTLTELLSEVEKNGYKATGRKYNVSDNTIRKWIKMNYL